MHMLVVHSVFWHQHVPLLSRNWTHTQSPRNMSQCELWPNQICPTSDWVMWHKQNISVWWFNPAASHLSCQPSCMHSTWAPRSLLIQQINSPNCSSDDIVSVTDVPHTLKRDFQYDPTPVFSRFSIYLNWTLKLDWKMKIQSLYTFLHSILGVVKMERQAKLVRKTPSLASLQSSVSAPS